MIVVLSQVLQTEMEEASHSPFYPGSIFLSQKASTCCQMLLHDPLIL